MHTLTFIGIVFIGSAISYLLKYYGTVDVDCHFFVGMVSGVIASGVSDIVRDYHRNRA